MYSASQLLIFKKLINHPKKMTDLIFGCYMKRQSNLCRKNIRKQEYGMCGDDQVIH